jgi:TM2 domain-containing membrane protein YozV
MKKFLVFVLFFAAFFSVMQAKAASYSIDEQGIDQLFATATETSMVSINANETGAMLAGMSSAVVASKEKDAVVAILLDFFLGGLGIHRFYLGTKPMTGIGYILTCGGIFGIVPLIDFIVLIIDNDDISPYIDNPKFFMW